MSCSRSSRILDLEAGLRTTPRDVRALAEAARQPALSLDEYLEFLRQFDAPSAAELRARAGPRGGEPFTLEVRTDPATSPRAPRSKRRKGKLAEDPA